MQIEGAARYHLTPVRMAIIKKTAEMVTIGDDVGEKGCHGVDGNVN